MAAKQFLVVAYDISDDRRRQKTAKALETYGVRCNYSVFECMITPSQIKKMQKQLKKICDATEDSVLYYYLCKACVEKREGLGRLPEWEPETVYV